MRARLIGGLTALLVGCGAAGCAHPPAAGPQAAGDSATPVPVSVVRHGNEITVSGDVADPAAKRALLDAVITSSDDITVIDRLGVAPAAATPDFSAAAPVFEAASGMDDFTLLATGDTVTLGGTAAKADEAAALAAAAQDAWPQAELVDEVVATPRGGEKSTEID